MGRRLGKLTPLTVRKMTKPGRFADGGGLYLQVTRSATRSWCFRYTRNGTAHEMGLGSLDTIGLAEARDRARRCREQLLDGVDPLAHRRQSRATAANALSFAEVAALYLTAHAPAWRSLVHERQWRNSLRDHVLPILGPLPVANIDTPTILRAIEPIWATKPETASRARQRTEAILDYASARGWRSGENPARWKGHLANILPAPAKVKPIVHHPAMHYADVPAFIAALGSRQSMAARALTFLILTACRSMEARGAVWREIDLKAAVWTIPSSRTKAAREHRVALSPAAISQLQAVMPSDGAEPAALIFPGRGDKPLSDVALAKLLPAATTVHGFRASFRTWAAEATHHPREVIEMALAHRLGDAVEQAYARGDLFEKRRALMADWGRFCTGGSRKIFRENRKKR